MSVNAGLGGQSFCHKYAFITHTLGYHLLYSTHINAINHSLVIEIFQQYISIRIKTLIGFRNKQVCLKPVIGTVYGYIAHKKTLP